MLDDKYKLWLEKQEFENVDEEKLKIDLIEELTFLSSMTVEEYTLYRKWQEIQRKYPPKKSNPFLQCNTQYQEVENVKNNIWVPKNHDDYKDLLPVAQSVKNNKQLSTHWSILKVFASTMINNSSIGRGIRYIIYDLNSGKYLGILCMSGDFLDLTPRDKFIGWSRDVKTKQHMINHTAIGSTIIPTQPLGYNYLGGKLLALMLISKPFEDSWKMSYGDILVGITTTSLYGSYSQYNSLKYWNKRGKTKGSTKYEPSKETVMRIREWLKLKHPRKYWEWYHATNKDGLPLKRDHKQRSLMFSYKEFGIDKKILETTHSRGIYFCPLYKNTPEYLRKEITDKDLVRRFDNSSTHLIDVWMEKYAKKRIDKIKEIIKPLFYDNIIGKSWEETKEIYIKEVGR